MSPKIREVGVIDDFVSMNQEIGLDWIVQGVLASQILEFVII